MTQGVTHPARYSLAVIATMLLLTGCGTGATQVDHPAATTALSEPRCPAPAAAVGQEPVGSWCAIVAAFEADQTNLHSLIVSRAGQTVIESYRPGQDRSVFSLWSTQRTFGPNDLHDMRSVSKSLVALAYGALLARAEVPAIDTRVSAFYADEGHLFPGDKAQLRIRDLLSMSAGLQWNEPSPVHRTFRDDQTGLVWRSDLVSYVLGRDSVAAPGVAFAYSGGLTSVLADIIEKSTGKNVAEVVAAEVLKPLGVSDWAWQTDFRGRPMAFAGLRLKPRDMVKIGELVRLRGNWAGRQVVPAPWIAEMTKIQVAADERYGYGYQWWVRQFPAEDRETQVAEAIGNGGQRIYVVPALDLVVTMTAGVYGEREVLAAQDRLFERIVAVARRDGQRSMSAR